MKEGTLKEKDAVDERVRGGGSLWCRGGGGDSSNVFFYFYTFVAFVSSARPHNGSKIASDRQSVQNISMVLWISADLDQLSGAALLSCT